MRLGEADTRSKLIDPAIHARGWTEELIRREETAGAIELGEGSSARRRQGRTDYTLRVRANAEAQPVAVALIEAKAESLPPSHGLEQAKLYATCKRLNVPFVFSTNGHLFVEYDRFSGLTSQARPLANFPTPGELRARYEQGMGFSLEDSAARPLLTRYAGGEATRRYYQDAAIRAAFEKIARCERRGEPKRVLLSLATGAGKTFIAVSLLRRIADAGQLRRALFVCDRDELRSQALGAMQNAFGSDAAPVSGANPQLNARVLVATYQTLGLDNDEADATFLTHNYPENYFSHVVIDECHRSAWGKWSEVLLRNQLAVQIGLTATPRTLLMSEHSQEAFADAEITADNLRYFGEPVYEYDIGQGIEDGYLAACEVLQFDLFHDDKTVVERESGVARDDLEGRLVTDARTGEMVGAGDARDHYSASVLEQRLVMPDRVAAMTSHLFAQLLDTGGPEQKTIIFCAGDHHADEVAAQMNNLYATWCREHSKDRAEPYAFKCTAASSGSDYLPDLRGASRRYFVATTVELLTTGVDVPVVRNIVFFKYVRSPIAFYQMVGRGTRIDLPSGKLLFRVYDYTDATRLFGQSFATRIRTSSEPPAEPPDEPPERTIVVEGINVRVNAAGHSVATQVNGQAVLMPIEEYRERVAARLVEEAPTLEEFRAQWIVPGEREALMARLPDRNRSAYLVRELAGMKEYDLYDVLGDLGYGMAPRTRVERSEAFSYKAQTWLESMPGPAASTLRAIAGQFVGGGTNALESPQVFETPEVVRSGGLAALRALGPPAEVMQETKKRIFAA